MAHIFILQFLFKKVKDAYTVVIYLSLPVSVRCPAVSSGTSDGQAVSLVHVRRDGGDSLVQ